MSEQIIIEAGRHELNYWRDLWRYRELFRVLAWRDLAVRYKQTVIGIAWALVRPLVTANAQRSSDGQEITLSSGSNTGER